MGAGQSGPHVITVETGEGEADVKVSRDFVNYVTNQTDSDNDNSAESTDEIVGIPPIFTRKLEKLYEEEKKKNAHFKDITDSEFEEAAINVKKQFMQSNVGHLVPACEDKQCKVLECYRNNSNRTLQCSQEVHQYIKCVENARKGLLVQTLPMSETT